MPASAAPVDARRAPPVATGAHAARTRALAALGVLGVLLAAALLTLLHALDAGEVDPLRRTLSEYGLGDHRAVFTAAVLAAAAATALVLRALVRSGVLAWPSAPAALLAAGAAALAVAAVVAKTDWALGPSPGGAVHRTASAVAYLCLPAALLVLGARPAGPRWARWLGLACTAWMAPFALGAALTPLTGDPWWRLVPPGLVQRGLVLTELLSVLALGLWALHAAAPSRAGATG